MRYFQQVQRDSKEVPRVATAFVASLLPGRGLTQGVALAVLGLELLAAGPGLGSGEELIGPS